MPDDPTQPQPLPDYDTGREADGPPPPPQPLGYNSAPPRPLGQAPYPADRRPDLVAGCLVYFLGFVAVTIAAAVLLPNAGSEWQARTLAMAVGGFVAACLVGGLLSGLVWRRWRFAAGLFIGVALSAAGGAAVVDVYGWPR
jgi:hypothetical protein